MTALPVMTVNWHNCIFVIQFTYYWLIADKISNAGEMLHHYYIFYLCSYFMKAQFMPTAGTSAAGVAVVLY